MPFFHYSQNNSGGHFSYNEARGITHHVVIEAATAPEADERLESAGGYFDGVDHGRDCRCCGDRWDRASRHDAEDAPLVHGEPPEECPAMWMAPGREVAVHYADGRVEWHGKAMEDEE